MITRGWSRDTVNRRLRRIVRCFRWGVSRELVPTSVTESLAMVEPLEKGRSEAKDREPVRPVAESAILATLPHLAPIVSDMVRLQRLTGCRPQEVCILRPCDVDTAGPVWQYRPSHHKTNHKGKERVVFIGPKGQDVLRPYLLRT